MGGRGSLRADGAWGKGGEGGWRSGTRELGPGEGLRAWGAGAWRGPRGWGPGGGAGPSGDQPDGRSFVRSFARTDGRKIHPSVL